MFKFSLRFKVALFFGLIVFIFISLESVLNYLNEKNNAIESINQKLKLNIKNLSDIVDMHVTERQKNVNTAINLAHIILYNYGKIVENKENNIPEKAINQITKAAYETTVNSWKIGGIALQNNNSIVDKIKSLSVETATIFQKIDSGYLRISTNVMNLDGTRAIGTYIPNQSPVIQTIEKGETYSGRAYVVNAWYLTAYEPIRIDGEVKGILYVGVKEKEFADLESIFKRNEFKTGHYELIDEKGEALIHNKFKFQSVNEIKQYSAIFASEDSTGIYESENAQGKKITLVYRYNSLTKSYIVGTVENNEVYAGLNSSLIKSFVITIIQIALLLSILIFYLNTQIFKPLSTVIEAHEKIAAKEIDFKMPEDRHDEIGRLYSSLNGITANFKAIIFKIEQISQSVVQSGQQLTNITEELASRASEHAAATEEISSSVEEMLATVNANVNRAEMTSDIAKSTSEKLEFSNKKFVETIDASIHVSHKINVISEIARKTDILSINAAIEAARSGDSGLGFAVVAQEIRKLADKSSISALEIEGLTKSGIKMSEISKAKLNELVDEIIKSAELVSEIVTASKEQQLGIEQINRSITGLIEIANINTAASEEISVSSQELLAQANLLNNAIMEFKI